MKNIKNLNLLYLCIKICTLIPWIYVNTCSGNNYKNGSYLGLDYMYEATKFKENFGGNIISNKSAPGVNLFFGYQFNQNFGIECGFELYKKMKRTVIGITEGTVVAGVAVPFQNEDGLPANWESYKTTISKNGLYFGATAKTNISYAISISLLLGLSFYNIKTQYNIFDDQHAGLDNEDPLIRTFSKTKYIPIIKASIEYRYNENIGFRALATYKQTSLFRMKSLERPFSDAQMKAKNIFSFGVGAIYYI